MRKALIEFRHVVFSPTVVSSHRGSYFTSATQLRERSKLGESTGRTSGLLLMLSQTEVLFIDEADRLKNKTFADVRDIFDELKIAVILVGTTKRLDPAVKEDEQVYNRFRSNYRFGTIQKEQLKQIVGVWERDIIALPVPSHLTTDPMLKLIRPAIGNPNRGYYIGLMDMVLREAAIRSLEKGVMHIDKDILAEVAKEYS